MGRIQGKEHKMGTYQINKISLSVFDDKRFIRTISNFFLQKVVNAQKRKPNENQPTK